MKIVFVGAGNMAAALIGGLIGKGVAPSGITAIDPHAETLARRREQYGIATQAAPDERISDADVLIIAVKPQVMKSTCEALAPFIDKQLVISVAAGVRTATFGRWLGGYERIVRAMPNTPALVGAGITGLYAGPIVKESEKTLAGNVLGAVGEVVWVQSETSIDAVTAISGSGPAYVFYFIEAMQRAGQQLGLDPAQSKTLALATFEGATRLALNSDQSIESLRESVTSKGGTTAAALHSFATSGVADAIVAGATAARHRALELGDELDCS